MEVCKEYIETFDQSIFGLNVVINIDNSSDNQFLHVLLSTIIAENDLDETHLKNELNVIVRKKEMKSKICNLRKI